jgi:hypothetical protein
MKESLIALRQLFISDQEFPESVEPGVRCLDDPTSILRRTSASALLSRDSWGIAMSADLIASGFTVISLIRIQESLSSFREGDDDGIKDRSELADVMSVGPGDDQRQRDATAVHQKVALGSFFSPGLSGSDQSFLVRGVL